MSDNTGGRGEPPSKTLPSIWGYAVWKCVFRMSVCERVGACLEKRAEEAIMCCCGSVAAESMFLVH